MRISRKSTKYPALLAAYMNTKEGKAFMLEIASQLIDGFEIDHRGKIKDVVINDKTSIKLDFE